MGWFEFLKLKKAESVIKANDAKQMVDQGQAILIDVRTLEEYHDMHIPKSILMPVQHIEFLFQKQFPDKKKNYIIYCRSGIRSKHAKQILESQGYLHVHDLGGIISWPYETETD
jgi:phage shock protein E